MLGEVEARGFVLVAHPQVPEQRLKREQDHVRGHAHEHRRKRNACELLPDLLTPAYALRSREARHEEPGGERSPRAPNPVDPEDVQRVIVAGGGLEERHRRVAEHPGPEPNGDRSQRAHEGASRRNRDEPGDRRGGGTEHGGLAAMQPLNGDPGDYCRGGRRVRGQEGEARSAIGR